MTRTPSLASCFSRFSRRFIYGWGTVLILILQAAGAMAQAPNISYTTPQVYATGNAITNLTPSNSGGAIPALTFRNVTTYAGSGADGSTPTNSTNPLTSTFNDIVSMVMDAKGNMYVAESGNGRIRKIAANGTVTMLMDLDGGLYNPKGLAINSSTGDLYFSVGQHAIYRIPNTNNANYPGQDPTYSGPTDANVSSYLMAGLRGTSGTTDNATGTSARFNTPLGMDVDAVNGFMYVVEYNGSRIRKISLTSPYAVTTVSTSGVSISQPEDLVVDATGVLFVTSAGANVVYRVGTDGVVTTFAGSGTAGYLDGQGTAARLSDPRGIDMDAAGNLYVADGSGSHAIRKITSAGYVSTLAGSGTGLSGTAEGVGTSARFDVPWEVIVDRTNSLLFVGDNTNDKVREVEIGGYTVWPSLTEGLSLSATTGVISGTPSVISRQVVYSDNFDDAAGGTGTSIAGHASYTGGWLRLTDAVNTQDGAFKVDASGVNTNGLQVDFKFITGKTSGGADGMSYSFSSDAVTTGGSWVQLGTGTGLSLSFVTFSGNTIKTNLYYGSGRTNATSVTGTLLASNTSSNALWLGRTADISLTIDNDGKVTVKVDGNTVFNQVQLPAGYAAADKSTWYHVFRAVTGGSNDVHAIDDLVIRQSLGAADHTVTGYNASGASSATLNVTVLNPPTLTTTAVTSNTTGYTISSGGNITSDGGSAVTARGVIWSTSSGPTVSLSTKTTDGTGTGTFTSSVTGLTPNTTYYLRAYATSTLGTGYGNEVSFTTPQVAPSISFSSASFSLVRNVAITPIALSNAGGAPEKKQVSTLAGSGRRAHANGIGTASNFNFPYGVWTDGSGNLFVADGGNNRIRKIDLSTGEVSTIAGSGVGTFADGIGSAAAFHAPYGITGDASGNLYVTDHLAHRIRKVVISTASVSNIAGNGTLGAANGVGTAATFRYPTGIALDGSGNLVISDYTNGLVRKSTPGGLVSTIAGTGSAGRVDGTGTGASFNGPSGVAVDASGNMYIADYLNHSIRRITPAGVVTTFAGSGSAGMADGTGTAASFSYPRGIAVGSDGNIYVADNGNNRIRLITPSGVVTTLAGTGVGISADGAVSAATFSGPHGIALDPLGHVYVADDAGSVIRIIAGYRISPALPAGLFFDTRTGIISGTPTTAQAAKTYTVYSQNSAGTSQTTITIAIAAPPTVATGTASDVTANSATLKGTVNANGSVTTTLTIKYATSQADVDAGNGTSLTVSPTSVSGNTVTSVTAVIASGLTANTTYYFRVSATNAAGTTNGSTSSFTTQDVPPSISYSGSPITLSKGSAITTISPVNAGGEVQPMQVSTVAGSGKELFADGIGSLASFSQPFAIAIGPDGSLFVADASNRRIRKIDPVTREVTTLAGSGTPGYADGAAAAADFLYPTGIAVDGSGNLYISDHFNNRIRKIDASTLQVTTLAGSGNATFANGNGTAASFFYPFGIAVDATQQVYVGDQSNHRVRKISSAGDVTTLAGSGTNTFANGTGTAASFYWPQGVAVDVSGNVYVADNGNQLIRKITSSGVVTTLVQNTSTQPIYAPNGIALDNSGNLYMTGASSNRVLKIIIATGQVIPLAGRLSSGFADGTGTAAAFNYPYGVAVDASGNLYVADTDNHRIRKIVRFSISPALPAGLSFNTGTGEITGNPTELSPATTYTVTASNGGGTSTASFSLEVSSSMLTSDVADITSTTATTGGTVGAFSGITERGVVYSTAAGPDISDGTDTKIPQASATTGIFTQNLTGLTANTTYYVRAYVIHSGGTTYGSEKSFKTNELGAFTDISKTFGDPKFSLTAPTAVSTGAFSFAGSNNAVATVTAAGEVTIAGAGSTTITATQAASGAYAEATKTLTLTVNKGTPTFTLSVPTTTPLNQVTGANTINVSGTSSDGQTVTMSIVSGGASGTLTATATPGQYTLSNVSSSGIITFEGSVAGNTNMNAATKQAAMDVTLVNQAITFNPTTPLPYTNGMTLTLSATGGGSGNAVTFDVVSGPATTGGTNGSTPSVSGPGTIVVKASQVGNSTYNAAPDVTRSIVVNAAAPIITSFTPTSATEGDVVTITGQYFDNVSAVSFGGTAATSFNVVNSTTITAVLATGQTGVVSVTTTGGTDTEAGFRYKALWTGATNAFNSTGNWSGGRVPQTDDDIIFSPTAASDLELDGNKTVGHVNFNGSGRSLRLGAHNLTIKGNLTMPGNITGTGRVIMNGGAAQTIIGGGDIPDLEINNSNGVTIDATGDELTVSGTLRSTSGSLTANGKLRLKSNSGGTARVGVVTGSITGNVIAERYVQRNENSDGTGRAWRLVSLPVSGSGTLRDFFMNGRPGRDLTDATNRTAESDNSGTPIVGHNYATASEATTAGFDWIGVANSVSSLRSYVGDAAGGSFASENVPDLDATTYALAAQGYMVFARGDRKLDFPSATSSGATTFRSTGTLKTGNQTVSVAPASSSKFTLVGNPYMSVLDLSALYASNTSVIEPSFWIWDANIAGTNKQGGYVNVYKSGTQWVTNTGSYIDPQLIESGMALFVEPASALSTATDLTIMESHKSAASSAGLSPFATDQSDDHGRIYVRLERADEKGRRQLIDGVMADFHSSFKTALGDQSDREKLRNAISRGAMWLSTDKKILSSEGLPWPTEVKRSIPLYMSGVGDQTLIVRVDPRGMRDRYVQAWLKDNVLKRQIEINMNAQTDYDFIGTGSASWDSTRFEIVYVEAGRPSTGVTLEPDDAAEQPSVKLYPNPSKSSDVKLSLRAMAPDAYTVHILDMSGRLVATRSINHRSFNGEYRILEGRLLSPGTYIIRLSDQTQQPKTTLRLVVD
jgi:sugar lactone lactonase YvrE